MSIGPKNILLTGATGFLGSRTLEKLIKQEGIGQIIASGRTVRPEAHIEAPHVQYILGDLSNQEYVSSLFESCPIHAIIHCAALSSPWGSDQAFHQANVLPQQHLIAEAQAHEVQRFVFISTPTVYATYHDRLNIKESAPLPKRFVNAYAASKREAEQLLEASDLPWITLRPRALIGRGDTVIMPRIMRAYEADRLKIIGTGKNIVDLTPVSNVVHAILLALDADESACGRIYNISNGKPVPLWDMIAYTMNRLGYPALTQHLPYSIAFLLAWGMEIYARRFNGHQEPVLTRYSVASMATSISLDISLAQHYLGYEAQQSVQEAIDEFVHWYQVSQR